LLEAASPLAIARLWRTVTIEAITIAAPEWLANLRLMALSTLAASTIAFCFAMSFCAFGSTTAIRSCKLLAVPQSTLPAATSSGNLYPISHGHKMFLECTGTTHGSPTVILATGRGLGSYQAWSVVQTRVSQFARVCSYDPLGAGESDHVPGPHPISEVVENMRDLFQSANLQKPFVLVGASLGGVLIRQYEEKYPSDVAGFVFVDSSHEEMEWRDAAISPTFDPNWNNPQFLQENGFLPPQQRLEWHDDVPLIVLERTDLPPCSAFPGLTQMQCDQINQAWHSFQVDLSHRSLYGQLRSVAGSGHAMHQQKPEAIAQAISDVIDETRRR
jgi:pimeloyl-ACP methyl ester carboxylesterase